MSVNFLCQFRFGYDAVVWVLGASAWWQNEKEAMMLTLQSICKTITHDELHFSVLTSLAGNHQPHKTRTYSRRNLRRIVCYNKAILGLRVLLLSTLKDAIKVVSTMMVYLIQLSKIFYTN